MTKNQLRVGLGFGPTLTSDQGPNNLTAVDKSLVHPWISYSPLQLDAEVKAQVLIKKSPELITSARTQQKVRTAEQTFRNSYNRFPQFSCASPYSQEPSSCLTTPGCCLISKLPPCPKLTNKLNR